MRNRFELETEPFEAYPEFDSELEFLYPETDAGWQSEVSRSSPEYIRWVQRSLNQILGTRLAVDGIIGSQTRGAIRSFQQRQGLRVDGIVGSQTEAALIAAGASPPSSTPAPSTPGTSIGSDRVCPEPARNAVEKCTHPGSKKCPPIPDLLCVRGVDGIPFVYPHKIGSDSATGLRVITHREQNRLQRFKPAVKAALSSFIRDMQRFAMPIEAIITYGSLFCRCINKSNTLSNHSYGDAIDIVGVRWSAVGGPPSRLRETIVHNFRDHEQRILLRRINACLRLSFATVIDYHRSDHEDHFHCDMNRERGRSPQSSNTVRFVQEALGVVLGRPFRITGEFDSATQRGLMEYGGLDQMGVRSNSQLNPVLDRLFTHVASGR